MTKVKKIDHIAILTGDLEGALSFWRDGLGMELGGVSDVPAEKSLVAFLPTAGSEIELVKPTTDDFGAGALPGKARPGVAPRVPGGGRYRRDAGAIEGARCPID